MVRQQFAKLPVIDKMCEFKSHSLLQILERSSMVEQSAVNRLVAGSNPAVPAIYWDIVQSGRTLVLGARCRRFKSCYSNHSLLYIVPLTGFPLFHRVLNGTLFFVINIFIFNNKQNILYRSNQFLCGAFL